MEKISDIVWPDDLAPKMHALEERLRQMGSALVAFSGGVDSTFLAAVAAQVLGPKALAVTAVSASIPESEVREARELAARIGIPHRVFESQEMANPEYVKNSPDRCYHCKTELFGELRQIAREEKRTHILDGSNADDLADFRPGRKAVEENKIESPLLDLGFTKKDIREASRLMHLPTADKPAFACLASRLPYGTPITEEALQKIDRAESALRALGFRQVRVRMHGEVARIELAPNEIAGVLADGVRDRIVASVKSAGFQYVALDLQGYRTGSLNETLKK